MLVSQPTTVPFSSFFASGMEEYNRAQFLGLDSTHTTLNVSTRLAGTAAELTFTHGVSHGSGITVGTALATSPTGPGSAVSFVVGYGVGYSVSAISISFSGLGSKINDYITNDYRNVYDYFNE